MEIRRYGRKDEARLFEMLAEEGDEWGDYHRSENRPRYKKALRSSIVYVAYDGGTLCGYARCRGDDGYGVYIYDLLVRRAYRGRQTGRQLMERVCRDFPDEPVYVMSDIDAYYEKLGYEREGSIFVVIAEPAEKRQK
jgi:GNAT superfamily N-acetyltransferase